MLHRDGTTMRMRRGPIALVVAALLGAMLVAVIATIMNPRSESRSPASATRLEPAPAHVVRACRRMQAGSDFRLMCPTRLPKGSLETVGDAPPVPVTTDALTDRGRVFGIDFSSNSLHFGVMDAKLSHRPPEVENLGPRRLGGHAGHVYFLSPDVYSYHSGHVIFEWTQGGRSYNASLHARGPRPQKEDFVLMDQLVAGLRPVATLPPPPKLERVGELGSRVTGRVRLGQGIADLAVNRGQVWVANYSRSTVTRVGARTMEIRGAVRVPRNPFAGMVAGGGRVWVANSGVDKLTALDSDTGKVVDTFEVGDGPDDLAADRRSLWVLNSLDATVSRLDAGTAKPAGAPLALGGRPTAVEAGPGGLWVADHAAGSVTRIDPGSGEATAMIPIGEGIGDIELWGGSVWVTDFATGTVTRIDAAEAEISARIPAGDTPARLAAGRTGLWVTDTRAGKVLRIDPDENRVVERVPVGIGPLHLAIGARSVWVTDADDLFRISVGR
jgi:DNA-binding beta-propeller fold protein YncE